MKDKINTFIFHAILKSSTYSIVKNELKSSNMDSADFSALRVQKYRFWRVNSDILFFCIWCCYF